MSMYFYDTFFWRLGTGERMDLSSECKRFKSEKYCIINITIWNENKGTTLASANMNGTMYKQ